MKKGTKLIVKKAGGLFQVDQVVTYLGNRIIEDVYASDCTWYKQEDDAFYIIAEGYEAGKLTSYCFRPEDVEPYSEFEGIQEATKMYQAFEDRVGTRGFGWLKIHKHLSDDHKFESVHSITFSEKGECRVGILVSTNDTLDVHHIRVNVSEMEMSNENWVKYLESYAKSQEELRRTKMLAARAQEEAELRARLKEIENEVAAEKYGSIFDLLADNFALKHTRDEFIECCRERASMYVRLKRHTVEWWYSIKDNCVYLTGHCLVPTTLAVKRAIDEQLRSVLNKLQPVNDSSGSLK